MILCVTHSNDSFTIDRVLDYFKQVGEPAIRFNTDEYLSDITLTQTVDKNGGDMVITLRDVTFSIHEVRAVWFRKLWTPKIVEEILESYRDNVAAEIQSTLFNFFNLLEKRVPCINPLSLDLKIGMHKYNQLEVANKHELLIPKTVITSDKTVLEAFFNQNGQNIIAKLQNSLSFSMGIGARFFPTTEINSENLPMLWDTLDCCPMIFQENIPKAYELRVAYVDGVCFTGKINTTQTVDGQTDWRNAAVESATWGPYELPEIIAYKLHNMMQDFGLSFGAIDLIKTPEGEYVFLEVNPAGEWGMLELHLNYPIAQTIAQTVLKKIGVCVKKY